MGDYRPDNERIMQIRTFIDANRRNMVEELKALCRVCSVRGEAMPHAPFGPNAAAGLEAASVLCENHGLTVRREPDRGYSIAGSEPSDKTIGIFCHCDTVMPNGEWIFTSPYVPVERNGLIIGRGVKDNKGSVLTSLYAMLALKNAGIELKHPVSLILGSNEETGMVDMKYFGENEKWPKLSLVPDCEYPVCRGEKTYYRYIAESGETFEDILDFNSGSGRGSVCAQTRTVVRASEKLEKELTAAAEGRTDVKLGHDEEGNIVITAFGVAAHGSTPKRGINAGGIAGELLLACPSLSDSDRRIISAAEPVFKDCLGRPFGIEHFDEDFRDLTTVITVIETVEGHLRLNGGVNHGTRQDGEELFGRIASYYSSFGWNSWHEAFDFGFLHEGDDDLLIDKMNDVYLALHGKQDMRLYVTPGGTYARRIPNAYAVGIEVPYTKKPEDFPIGHGLVHQPDECMPVDSLLNGAEMLAAMLIAIDEEL